MKKLYGNGYVSPTQVYSQFTRFKNDRVDLNEGRIEVSDSAELVEKVRVITSIDVNFTLKMLVQGLNRSKNTIQRISSEDLGKRKVCSRFVPLEFNED